MPNIINRMKQEERNNRKPHESPLKYSGSREALADIARGRASRLEGNERGSRGLGEGIKSGFRDLGRGAIQGLAAYRPNIEEGRFGHDFWEWVHQEPETKLGTLNQYVGKAIGESPYYAMGGPLIGKGLGGVAKGLSALKKSPPAKPHLDWNQYNPPANVTVNDYGFADIPYTRMFGLSNRGGNPLGDAIHTVGSPSYKIRGLEKHLGSRSRAERFYELFSKKLPVIAEKEFPEWSGIGSRAIRRSEDMIDIVLK